MTTTKWEAYGDVNPLEHGGEWIRKEGDQEFTLVAVVNDEEGNFFVTEAYIDITDEWIDREAVEDFIGADENTPDELIVSGAFSYYGTENFGGHWYKTESAEVAKEHIEAYGIEIE